MVTAQLSTPDDFDRWLELARQVEPLFGPMVDDPNFRDGLKEVLSLGKAYCIKVETPDGGEVLSGGIIVSPEANEICWLAVDETCRGQGIGKALLQTTITRLDDRRPIIVTTFDRSVESGFPARRLYQSFGFEDSGPGDLNPAGIPTVVMVRPNNGG